jgi:hypothetical protein
MSYCNTSFSPFREKAELKFLEIVAENRKGLWLATLPYKMGIFTAVTVATVSIPMIFEINTVLWFNELYVTSGMPLS